MPKLTVIAGGEAIELPFAEGSSVREVLEAADVPVRWGCMGNGACGLCVVRIQGETPPEPTENELLLMSAEQLESGVRLACQLSPHDGLRVELEDALLRHQPSKPLPAQSARPASVARPSAPPSGAAYGVAVDVGTTHLRVSLCDLESGERLAARVAENPQSRSGADVVTRLVAAGESSEAAEKSARVLAEAVSEAVRSACASVGVDTNDVARVVAVGNTPMLVLMTGGDPRVLLDPQSWTLPVDCCGIREDEWGAKLGVSADASVEPIQPLAGFVGSDLLAAVLATDLVEGRSGLLIDFGTNSEIALWDGATLWVTSAAGGPAFESIGLTSGMPADIGAIQGVSRDSETGQLRVSVIGDGPAMGLCGSGFVDLVAVLRASDDLSATGRLRADSPEDGFPLQGREPNVRLTNRDVNTFQQAKAAIGAGVSTLLKRAGMAQADIERVCVCGAFGRKLNPGNASAIGLLPDVPVERIELHGEAALTGCEHVLVDAEAEARLEVLRECAVLVNLAQTPGFDDVFLDCLYLQPLGVTGG